MAAHRRSLPTGAIALLALVPMVEAASPVALRDVAPPTAPWWPPTLSDSMGAAPSTGWAMSKHGPMFMPAAVNALVYGPPGAMAPGPKLQKILAKVWEHLASRVEDLESMERRAGLLEEEVAQLERRPLASESVLGRLQEDLATLRRHAAARAKELGEKFQQVRGFRGNLQKRFPASRAPLREFFKALEKASYKVDDRYRGVGRTLTNIRERLVAMKRAGARDEPRARPSHAPEIPPGAAKIPTAHEIRERMDRRRADREAQRAVESMAVMPGPMAPEASASEWDASWESDAAGTVREPVPVARSGGDPVEAWETNMASPGQDAMYAGSSPEPIRERVGEYSSARDLIRARYERLKQKAAGGATTEDLEREIRSHRPGDGAAPSQPIPERLGPPQPVDGEELLEDFLEADTVMDPYLSKAVPTKLKAPDEGGDSRLAEGMKRMLAQGQGPAGVRVRSAPKVEGLGNFATRLEHELELAARTEGLDDRVRFRKPQRAKVPLPQGSRNVASIMAELEALDQE